MRVGLERAVDMPEVVVVRRVGEALDAAEVALACVGSEGCAQGVWKVFVDDAGEAVLVDDVCVPGGRVVAGDRRRIAACGRGFRVARRDQLGCR